MLVSGAAVIVCAPDGIGTQGQRGEETVGKTTGTAQVGLAAQINSARSRYLLHQFFHRGVIAVIYHDDVVDCRAFLVGNLLQAGTQKLHAVVGDDDGRDAI